MARYSRILKSARYYAAIDNYIKWITDASKKTIDGVGKPRDKSRPLFIKPFAAEGIFTSTQYSKVSAAIPAWAAYGAKFAGYTKDVEVSTDKNVLFSNKFRAARVVIKTGVSQTKTKKTSHITGMSYSSYGGKSVSIPFGRKDAAEGEEAAYNAIKALLIADLNPTTTQISRIKERF